MAVLESTRGDRGLAWRLAPPRASDLLFTLLLLLLGFLVLFPLLQIALQSVQIPIPGQGFRWGTDGWQALFSDRSLQRAAVNTLLLTLARQSFSLVLAVVVAWLLARTDVPGSRLFEFLFWLSFFIPSLTATLTWILMLDPKVGLINQATGSLGLRALGLPALDIYSFWGIVWVHVLSTTTAIKVMVLTPAFRNMNAALEEASRTSGGSVLHTIGRVLLPLMLPTILAVELLAILRSIEAFEIEQILGTPIRLLVLSTWIYDQLYQERVPRYFVVCALAMTMILTAVALIALQRWIVSNRQYTTITGKFEARVTHLGPVRWPAFAFLLLLVGLMVGVPIGASVMGTFMKLFGYFTADPWTLRHWETALRDPILLRSLQNTLVLALCTGLVAVVLHSITAYIIVRTRYRARGLMDWMTWLPFTVPGITLSLGLLTMFLQPPFRPLYGSMATLVLALVISGMPYAVQIAKGSLLQLGNELEEASWASGGNWWYTYRRVVLPLISPTLVVIGVINFVGAARNIAQVTLLSNSAIRPLSLLQLDYLAEGKYEIATVLACILLLMSLGFALLARVFGYRGVGS